jgi:hypothetical protein
MTLCIAAACETKNGQPRIVLCTDWKSEETVSGASLGSSENTDKLYWLKKGWAALIAGSETHGQELVRAYVKYMQKSKPSKWGDVQEELKGPAQAQRETLIDAYLKKTTGVSLEWFLDKGKDKLPPETVRDCISDIKRVTLNASMIIAGFVTVQFNPGSLERRRYPLIFLVQSDGSTRTCRDFAAIGEGKIIAIPALKQRDQNASAGLLQTIYQVFEAKRLSEIIPSVGEAQSIDVLAPGGRVWSLSDKGYEQLEKLYKRFGPRAIKEKDAEEAFRWDRAFVEPFDFG